MYASLRIVARVLSVVAIVVLHGEAMVILSGPRIADVKCQEYGKVARLAETTCSPSDKDSMTFPHQAVLGYRTVNDSTAPLVFGCGGSLISERFVLTAAHCLRTVGDRRLVVVRLGEVDLTDEYDGADDFGVETTVVHPKYRVKHSYHDIGLIKLNEIVEFTENYRPACLWTSMIINVTSVIATGFGSTASHSETSNFLNMVELDVLDQDECFDLTQGTSKFPHGLEEQQLCIGWKEGGKDTCKGDSGGPAQVILQPEGCLSHIIGITSIGASGCGAPNTGAIYIRVASFIDWIEEVVWK